MRVFQSPDGVEWQVMIGRESWGGFVTILSPTRGNDEPRQAPLTVGSMEEAQKWLSSMNEEDLAELLEASEPKPRG